MRVGDPTLHLVCGKIASGKSTLARRLAMTSDTVLIEEDRWLSRLYPEEIASVDDYVRCSRRLHGVMGDHVGSLLCAGLSVVLDCPANTMSVRNWMRGISENAGTPNHLHHLDVSDTVCKARLKQRNESGVHDFAPSDADYDMITSFFVPPSSDEGFNVSVYSEGDVVSMSR